MVAPGPLADERTAAVADVLSEPDAAVYAAGYADGWRDARQTLEDVIAAQAARIHQLEQAQPVAVGSLAGLLHDGNSDVSALDCQ